MKPAAALPSCHDSETGRGKSAASSPEHRPPSGGHSTGSRGVTLPSSLGEGSTASRPKATVHRRQMPGRKGNRIRPAGNRKVGSDGGSAHSRSTDPASPTDVLSLPAGNRAGAETAETSGNIEGAGAIRSKALSAVSPLSTVSSPTSTEQQCATQQPACHSNPYSDQDGPKSPPASQKLKTRVKLALCALVTIIFTALTVLAIATVVWNSPVITSSACKTHACLAYAERLLLSINESVNPCKSFTRFVCDGWQQRHERDVWENQFISTLDKITTALNNIGVPETGQNKEQRAAIIYRSCANVLEGKAEELPVVKKALFEAGIVWPQPFKNADVLYTLLHSSLKLGWDVLLDVGVKASGGVITLAPGKFLRFVLAKRAHFETAEKKEAYFEFLKERFERAGAPSVTYGQNLALEEPALQDLSDALQKKSSERRVDIFLKASDVGLTEDRWRTTLQKLNISLASSVLQTTTVPEYLETILSLWRENGSDSFHTLISWCTIQVAALFANKDLVSNYYDQDYSAAQIHHKIFCVAKAMFFSMRAPFERYNADVLQGNALAVAKRLALSVQISYFRRLSNWAAFDENITVVRNRESQEMVFRNFEQSTEDETLDRGQLPDMTQSFVRNWQQSVHLKKVPKIERAVRAIYDRKYFVVSFEDQDFELMPYALSYPLFDSQLPSSVNYGGLGAEIARALGALFLHFNSENSSQVQSVIDCMKASPFGDVPDVKDFMPEVISYGALTDAYKREGHALDNTMLGLEKYSGIQLFFIALCYFACDGSSGDGYGDALCNLPLQNMPEFAKAFRCEPGDPMNPAKKCQLF